MIPKNGEANKVVKTQESTGIFWRVYTNIYRYHFNKNFRILKWRYCTIFLAIFCGDIPLHRPYIGLINGRYLQFRFLKWPLITEFLVKASRILWLFPPGDVRGETASERHHLQLGDCSLQLAAKN